jgi:peptidoglycan/xylan/chitin deacetylase (PgdA/CDA1 family)
VALTFDAAYDPAPLNGILSALEEAGIRATFFLTGEFAEDFPESVRSIVAAGHTVGNHSYSHPDFTTLGKDEIRRQLRDTAALLVELGAGDPRPLFRPPFGARNKTVLGRLAEEGYLSIFWTIDTLDWKPERTPGQILNTVKDGIEPGAIVLMHVGSRQTEEILPRLIEELRAEGYGFVTVTEGLGGAPQ